MQNKEVTLTQQEFDAIEGCSTAFQKGFFMVTCGKLYGDGFNICDSCVKKAIKAKKKKLKKAAKKKLSRKDLEAINAVFEYMDGHDSLKEQEQKAWEKVKLLLKDMK